MTRRKFLVFTLALIMILSTLTGCQTNNNDPMTYDVIVVGAGAAGLSAAIEAAEAGAKVAILEKMPVVGGSTLFSDGLVYATGSKIQLENAINDSSESLVNFWIDKAEGQVDVPFLQLVSNSSASTIDWLEELGVTFDKPIATGASPVLRAHPVTGKGSALIDSLKARAEKKKVTILTETSAMEILVDDANVITGVKALDASGNEIIYNTKAVVLATGGMDYNLELMEKYHSDATGLLSFSNKGNTGDGLNMALALNAGVVAKDAEVGYTIVAGETEYNSEINQFITNPYLLVNQIGERFVDESGTHSLVYEDLVKQEGQVAYLIFDQTNYAPVIETAVDKSSVVSADTIEELAGLIGIDPTSLSATVKYYNDMIEYGKDTQFGKTILGITPVATPKYYAVKIVPAIMGTLTGIKTDLDAQVLDADGNVITGLYAAGEIASGDFYNKVYPADGTSLQVGITMGRIAGAKAGAFAK